MHVKKLEKRQAVEAELNDAQEKYYFTVYFIHQEEVKIIQKQLTEVNANYRATFVVLEKVQVELADLARGVTRQEVFDNLQARYQAVVHAKNDLERLNSELATKKLDCKKER